MSYSTRRSAILGISLIFILVTVSKASQQRNPGDAGNLLKSHSQQVSEADRRLEEVFGPLPAVASTPFLGLAVLTGTALLMDQPAVANSNWRLVQQIRRNSLILEAKTYASWWLLGGLVILALLTGLANSGKLEGGLGKLARSGENVTAGLAYLVVGIGALTSNSVAVSSSGPHPTIVFASVFPAFESSTLSLIVAAIVALAAMMVVRFALDVLIWLSPVPLIDMVFEACKAIFSLAFLSIYLANPIIAAILGALLLVPCLVLLPWAIRLLSFAYRIVFCPILAQLSRGFAPRLVEPALAHTVGGHDVALACRANVLKARGLKKRQTVVLQQSAGRTTVRPLRTKRRTRGLCELEEQILLGRSLAWIELRVVSKDGRLLDRIALPRSMMTDFDTLLVLLGARDAGDFGAIKVLRAVGKAARESVGSMSRAARNSTSLETPDVKATELDQP